MFLGIEVRGKPISILARILLCNETTDVRVIGIGRIVDRRSQGFVEAIAITSKLPRNPFAVFPSLVSDFV